MEHTTERVIKLEGKQRELCRRVVKLEEEDDSTRDRFDLVHARITKIQVRVAFYAGGGGLVGTLLGLGGLKFFGG